MNFGETLKDKKSWKLHNLIFPALVFAAFFMFIENTYFGLRELVQTAYYHAGLKPFNIKTIDDKIPILSGFVVVYFSAILSWLVMPIVMYCLYGKKQYAKFLGISTLVFITNFLIGVCFYTNANDVSANAIKNLEGSTNWFKQINLLALKKSCAFSCLPSNHCACSLLLFFGFVDFGFFNQKNDVKSKGFIAKCILIPLFGIYVLSICFSTMTLKFHYFIDFWAALGVCIFWWIVCSVFKKINFMQKPYILAAVNFEVTFGYLSKEAVEWKDYMTTCLKSSLPSKILQYDKKQFVTHFVLSDILCFLILCIAGFWWVLWGVIIQFPTAPLDLALSTSC